ncbi:hypothetical protein LPJ66_011487, partial [Kickxella alabastrina]
ASCRARSTRTMAFSICRFPRLSRACRRRSWTRGAPGRVPRRSSPLLFPSSPVCSRLTSRSTLIRLLVISLLLVLSS